MNILAKLIDNKLLNPPYWVRDNLSYVTIVGSEAYGYAQDLSDKDIYSCVMPPIDELFPHKTDKYVYNFGKKLNVFETYTKHAVEYNDSNYDITIHGIVKYFNLLVDNNPTQLETLFTPINCILYINDVGQLIRDNRKLFLSKKLYHRYIGYSWAQLHSLDKKRIGKRKELINQYSFDVKAASHIVRLILFGEQLLETGELEMQRDCERLKAIRRGEVSEKEIRDYFTSQEKHLLEVYNRSQLPYSPDIDKIKLLLLKCIESHYGSIDKCITNLDKESLALKEVRKILESVGY